MSMAYAIRQDGESRSFPDGDPFLAAASPDAAVIVLLGARFQPDPSKTAILVELGTECLGVHTGEAAGEEGSNVLGFARYRNGDDLPSGLVELVRQPNTDEPALAAARAVFEEAGLAVVVSADRVGRIVDRLVRPKYNAALRLLDDGLAKAEDMDLACRLGLGYPDGPVERAVRGGLAWHHAVSTALFAASGQPGDAPARAAGVAAARSEGR